MYFERYGKLFLSDVPLMHDRQFFVDLLAGVEAEPDALGEPGTAPS